MSKKNESVARRAREQKRHRRKSRDRGYGRERDRLDRRPLSEDSLIVYRGTSLTEELRLWAESDGYVYSEAARDGYYRFINDGYDFRSALSAGAEESARVLKREVDNWGCVANYAEAHSEFGTELAKNFGPRPAISWTTDLDTARRFAGKDGYVVQAKVRIADIVTATSPRNEESEVLLSNAVWAPTRTC